MVRVANLSYANDDLTGTAYGSYNWTGEGPGSVDLTVQLSRADGKSTAKYLPLSTLMGARTREWVANAVLSGQASDARLRLQGDLRDFPFTDPLKGLFQVTAKVSAVARMPIGRFVAYSTAGAFLWSMLLVYAGTVLGANWEQIRHALQPFDLAIALGVVALVVLFVWWRLGMPGRRRGGAG